MLVRFTSPLPVFGITLRSWLWEAYRLTRQRSRLAVGIAAVALAAVIGVTVGMLAGSAPPAHAASNPSGNVLAAGPAGHPRLGASQHGTAQHGPAQPAAGQQAGSQHGGGQHGGGQQASAQHGGGQHGGGQHASAQNGAAQHSGSQHGTAQRGAAKTDGGQHAAAAPHPAQTPVPTTSARPYSIYDSVTPSDIPASQYSIATYADGHYAATASQVVGRGSVLWIDVTGSNPSAAVLDVEPGDASPAAAASWAWHKLHSDPSAVARIYTMRSEWPSVQAAISKLPSQMQSQVHYWIADPTGVNHLVPGSDATQWYWGSRYDITTANPGF